MGGGGGGGGAGRENSTLFSDEKFCYGKIIVIFSGGKKLQARGKLLSDSCTCWHLVCEKIDIYKYLTIITIIPSHKPKNLFSSNRRDTADLV